MDELAPMNEEMSELDLANEVKVKQVLELTLWGDEEKPKYTISEACDKVGISRSTYYRLRQKGMVEGPKQQIAHQVSTAVQEILLPIQRERYELIARIALGLPPRTHDEDGMPLLPASPSIQDILKANQMIDKILPVQSIDREASGAESPLEHMKNYQPGTINIAVFGDNPPDWLYNGQAGTPRFGELVDGDDDVIDAEEEDEL